MTANLVGVETRLGQLCDDGQHLLDHQAMGETDEGVYYLVSRVWQHPDVDGAQTLSIRYAYLTRGDGSDGWVDNGINVRVDPGDDPADVAQQLAQMMATSAAKIRGGRE